MSTPLNSSILKGFEILSLFSTSNKEISTATVVEQLGMNNATAHRFLVSLEHAGAIRATRRGYFAIGPKIEELGFLAEETEALAMVIQPQIDALSRKLSESVMVCRLTRRGPACIAVANSSRVISVNINVGTLLPFQSTAQGKLWLSEMKDAERKQMLGAVRIPNSKEIQTDPQKFLAGLDRIREQGFALNLGENEPDIAAISVPVRDSDGKIGLTLSAFGMLSRFNESFLEKSKPHLLETAERISKFIC